MDGEERLDEHAGNVIAIPPGSAKIRGLVFDIEIKDEQPVYHIRIQEVMEYGMATPVLPVCSEIQLYVTPELKEEEQKKLSIGQETVLHIHHTIGRGEVQYWSLVKFINAH